MLSPLVEVTFRVSVETDVPVGEVVCVVGDYEQLGHWKPQHAKILKRERVPNNHIWSRTLRLPSDQAVHYRYFIGFVRDADHEDDEKDVMIRMWETNIQPRKFSIKDDSCLESRCNSAGVHTFGSYDNQTGIDKGWLTGQTETHLRLHSAPIRMWKSKYRQQKYRVSCTAIDLRYKDTQTTMEDDVGEESNHDLTIASGPHKVNVSVLNAVDQLPHEQPQFGTLFKEKDYLLFRLQSFETEFLGFQFDFYLDSDVDIPQHIGMAYLLPVNFQGTNGIKNVPIIGLKHKPIGQLSVDYLIVKPLKANSVCDMSVSYAHYWNKVRGPLDVGHRGMGSSYTKSCEIPRENTIASLMEAGGHGADYVEFDVQLSSDEQVVVYHDFRACLSLKKKGRHELQYFDIPVSDLSYDQLQMLKLDHVSEKAKVEIPISNNEDSTDEPEVRQPFPLLKNALESIDPHVGFNIEVKYCMQLQTGELEEGIKHFMERNRYLDLILSDVLDYKGTRRIIFSSFDPDICTLLRLKQNRYPVQFLTQGVTTKYAPYKDVRTQSLLMSASYASSEGLLGVNAQAEEILKDMSLIQKCKSMGLVLMVWGEEANQKENIISLKQAGVDGVIYDRINEIKDNKKNTFQMEYENKLTLLHEMGCLSQASKPGSHSITINITHPHNGDPDSSMSVGSAPTVNPILAAAIKRASSPDLCKTGRSLSDPTPTSPTDLTPTPVTDADNPVKCESINDLSNLRVSGSPPPSISPPGKRPFSKITSPPPTLVTMTEADISMVSTESWLEDDTYSIESGVEMSPPTPKKLFGITIDC